MRFIKVGHLNLKYDYEKVLPFYWFVIVEETTGNLLRVLKMLFMVQLMPKPIRIYDNVFWIKIILVLNVAQIYFICKKVLFFNCLTLQLWETNWRINVKYKTFIHRWESVHIYMWKIEVQFYFFFSVFIMVIHQRILTW